MRGQSVESLVEDALARVLRRAYWGAHDEEDGDSKVGADEKILREALFLYGMPGRDYKPRGVSDAKL